MGRGGRRWRSLLILTALLVPLALLGRPELAGAQGCAGTATVTLTPQGSAVTGTVTLGPSTNGTFTVTATINGLLPGQVPTLTIPTNLGTATATGTPAALNVPETITQTLTGIPTTNGTLIVTANNPLGGVPQT